MQGRKAAQDQLHSRDVSNTTASGGEVRTIICLLLKLETGLCTEGLGCINSQPRCLHDPLRMIKRKDSTLLR
jgi:hypothetical protein